MSHSGLHHLRPDEPPLEGGTDVRASSRRLLFIEDDDATRRSLAEALRGDGFDVDTAADGREALQLLRDGPRPSAILLDVMMPVMDGWDFRHVQLNDPSLRDIPVLLVTASGFSHETIRMQFGDVELIRKPIRYGALREALDRASGPPRPRREPNG
jgi:CheY-like chemotaxis protein